MNKINFTPFPNLTTERLVLRQINTEDENEFFIIKSNEEILKFLDHKAKTFDEARQFLQKINEEITNNVWINWGITLKNENKLIGTICFWNIFKEDSKAEIGYELMPGYQGKGIMQEAMKIVIEYGFENMKLNSIEALPNPNNSKSVNLLERNNFVRGTNFEEIDPSTGKILERVTYTLNKKEV